MADYLLTQLREQGVALLPGAFPLNSLAPLKEAAGSCFEAIETGRQLSEHYRFNRFSNSLLLPALLDFGCTGLKELLAPLSEADLDWSFRTVMGCPLKCNMEQSWVRKKYAPRQAPEFPYHPQDWHQDGALGVRFPLKAGLAPPMTQLLTCWLPLNSCGEDSPGLEFIRRRQEVLLHFTELNDADLRLRFAPDEFWAPVLELGDGLIFLNGTLHRTYIQPTMVRHRLSVEYRMFPL